MIGFPPICAYNKDRLEMLHNGIMEVGMIRKAQTKDISRLAEIEVFGKRVAYRPIFQDDDGSFNQIQEGYHQLERLPG